MKKLQRHISLYNRFNVLTQDKDNDGDSDDGTTTDDPSTTLGDSDAFKVPKPFTITTKTIDRMTMGARIRRKRKSTTASAEATKKTNEQWS